MFFQPDHKNLMGMKWEWNTLIYSLPITLHSASNIRLVNNSREIFGMIFLLKSRIWSEQ